MAGKVDTLTRFGLDRESASELSDHATRAEAVLGIHGVSTRLNSNRAGRRANLQDVVDQFPGTRQTGLDRKHYTVVLPKPVTDEIAEQFHELFRPAE